MEQIVGSLLIVGQRFADAGRGPPRPL